MDNYQQRSHELARRFLQTAIVVDDEAYMASEQGNGPNGPVVEPSRSQTASGQNGQDPSGRGSRHSLDAGLVINSFSKLGIICGVVSPADSTPETMRKADIVVLDWLLQDQKPQRTLTLLGELLAGESDRNSLRLVSIYTGEPNLETVCADVVKKLEEAKLSPVQDNDGTTIAYQHGRVVLYAKSGVNLGPLQDRSVEEKDLPEKLIEDFSSMTSGLLPRIALTSLTVVRENEHKVLDRFGAKLDPAFLTHKACLPNPENAERQMVNHIAEELRGLMDEAVAKTSSEDADAVKCWIKEKAEEFTFRKDKGTEKLNTEETINLINKGLKESKLSKSAFKFLSAGFSGNDATDLDEQLAWIMTFRAVYSASKPMLWLGSVVTELSDEREQHLICMRPRCNCVRLEGETTFFFLSLVEPAKKEEQIVVKIDDRFERLGIEFDSANWVLRKFKPDSRSNAIIAERPESNSHFEFKSSNKTQRYKWRGELKAEYAQRIAQKFAEKLSRVAVDESEWLRRIGQRK
ncbi:MAG: response regulator receiver domain [Cyanobacteria bacterium MAG CAR3_bin_5]|nr:response regulator receiver domain [Cyanobacteria bacterium MAG CAR3_bin_5]MCY4236123.1 response regulator receiver domain [Cyanobacteria bacterium MAG CAR2_bin_4]